MRVRFDDLETQPPVMDRWFRALDQRRIYTGADEWLIHVTGIHVENSEVWVQIAETLGQGGSILLRVNSRTSVGRAVRALRGRGGRVVTHPAVVIPSPAPRSHPKRRER